MLSESVYNRYLEDTLKMHMANVLANMEEDRDPRVNQRLDSSGSRVERRRLASPSICLKEDLSR